MSNKIMELANDLMLHAHPSIWDELQAEVTCMEQELARLRELWLETEAKNSELRTKLATLEAQEPVGHVTADGFSMLYGHKQVAPGTKLYLSPCAASVPMPDTEVRSLADRHWPNTPQALVLAIVRTAETFHKIGVKP